MKFHFIADVGGTNIRIATVTEDGFTDVNKMQCTEYETIGAALSAYCNQFSDRVYASGCVAIACPVQGDQVTMTNHSWAFSQHALRESLGLEHLYVINDFTAVAHSLPVLADDQVLQIGTGTKVEKGNAVVFGPGTGLGVEHMTYTQQGWKTLDGEGGHMDFAPVDETDVVIWRYLTKKLGRASAEEVMSGRGLVNIYAALCDHAQQPMKYTQPAEVTNAALNGECELCLNTLQQFCRIMGSFAGNLAMNAATTGGLFIGGGIAGRFPEFLQSSEFRARFEQKGVMKDYVKDIPTYLITEPDHGLLGAMAYLNQQLALSN